MLCNPKGYGQENPRFDPEMVVEVERYTTLGPYPWSLSPADFATEFAPISAILRRPSGCSRRGAGRGRCGGWREIIAV